MKAPGWKILYWSASRVKNVAEAYGIDLRPHAAIDVATPAWGPLPTARRQQPMQPLTRTEQARRVENALGTRIEHDFGSSGPCGFAAGSGTVTFARLQNGDHEDRAVIFADWRVDSCRQAGICLFGSMGTSQSF